ncbi:unnamed protein product, partial [Oppiella nova]
VCATDAHLVWGVDTDVVVDTEGRPMVLGHEGAGVVESVGEGVKSVAPGDKVVLMWMPECSRCDLCANPKTNFCLSGNPASNSVRVARDAYMKVNGKPVLQFCCAVGTGYASATNIAKVHKGSKCVIWGMGAIGLSVVLGCKDAGAQEIICIDRNDHKGVIAKQLGATRFINPKTSSQSVDEILKGYGGVDYAFDCIGNIDVINSCIQSLSTWGFLVLIGLPDRGQSVSIPAGKLLQGAHVSGGHFGNAKPRELNQRLVDLHCSARLPIEPMITQRLHLNNINKAFDDLRAGKTIRTVIDFE